MKEAETEKLHLDKPEPETIIQGPVAGLSNNTLVSDLRKSEEATVVDCSLLDC